MADNREVRRKLAKAAIDGSGSVRDSPAIGSILLELCEISDTLNEILQVLLKTKERVE